MVALTGHSVVVMFIFSRCALQKGYYELCDGRNLSATLISTLDNSTNFLWHKCARRWRAGKVDERVN